MQLAKRLFAALTVFMVAPLLAVSLVLPGAGTAFAQAGAAPGIVAMPKPWEMGMQPAQNMLKQRIIDLHDLVLVIITLVTIFVGVLLLYVIYRFSAHRNPVPSQTSHHTGLEIAWTVVPVLILVVMAIPSFRLIYYLDRTPAPDMTIKVTAHQWYWQYTYPDHGDLDIESRYVREDEGKPGHIRLLSVDNQMVIPAGKKVRILTGSADVIHSFFIPSLGIQRYAIPGRTIELWITADKPGVYYGECNQICGTDHSRMPISVRAMSEPDFKAWAAKEKKSASVAPSGGTATGILAAASGFTPQGIQR
jgi:cytochrome c oxidase subunit 2